ncbi:hypothetical protein ACQPZA_20595 [Pseudonocardia xinjiangensis]|uniref:hypothetical protein n=1 Tax=Pseudonocardia xinjiangensis TaxID=75289 RepID=UPI003D8DC52A
MASLQNERPAAGLALGISTFVAAIAVIVGLDLSQNASIAVLIAVCGVFVVIDRKVVRRR